MLSCLQHTDGSTLKVEISATNFIKIISSLQVYDMFWLLYEQIPDNRNSESVICDYLTEYVVIARH